MAAPELLTHTELLLTVQEWSAAALHVRQGAQTVMSRAEGWAWRRLVDRVPPDVRGTGAWPHALAWVAYRVADGALLDEALARAPGPLPAFGAFQASLRGDWPDTLRLAAQALAPSGNGHPADRRVAARFHACARAELGQPGWEGAFREALRSPPGRDGGDRDRGLLCLEFAYHLIRAGQEGAARDVLASALADLRQDPWSLTLAQANLGITCLRLGEVAEAEQALRRAVHSGSQGAGRAHLSTAWRGLGGLYLHLGQPARAAHAYEEAQARADNPADRSRAMRSAARVARLRGHLNDAMTLLHDVLRHDHVEPGQRHPAYVDLAALRVLTGDRAGAREALALTLESNVEDGWRAGVVAAELRRLGGEPGVGEALRALEMSPAWARQEAWIFPELFASLGPVEPPPPWEATVCTDGPVRVRMNGLLLGLRPHRPAAALMALLALHGGQVSAERALDALDLPGRTPRARRQELSRTVRELWEVLGWRGGVSSAHGLLRLSPDVRWHLVLPPPAHTDTFCEGRLDPWIVDWRNEQAVLNISERS